MDQRYAYPNEVFSAAVESLAENPDRIRGRLVDVVVSRLERAFPFVAGPLPDPDLERRRAALDKRLMAGGRVRDVVDGFSEDEAVEVAREIVALASEIRAAYYELHID